MSAPSADRSNHPFASNAVGASDLRARPPSFGRYAPKGERQDVAREPALAADASRLNRSEARAVVPIEAKLTGITVDYQEFAHADISVERDLRISLVPGALDLDEKIRTSIPMRAAIDRPAVGQDYDNVWDAIVLFPLM